MSRVGLGAVSQPCVDSESRAAGACHTPNVSSLQTSTSVQVGGNWILLSWYQWAWTTVSGTQYSQGDVRVTGS